MRQSSCDELVTQYRALSCPNIATLIAWAAHDRSLLPIHLTLRQGDLAIEDHIDSPAGYFRHVLRATARHENREQILSLLDQASAHYLLQVPNQSERPH